MRVLVGYIFFLVGCRSISWWGTKFPHRGSQGLASENLARQFHVHRGFIRHKFWRESGFLPKKLLEGRKYIQVLVFCTSGSHGCR